MREENSSDYGNCKTCNTPLKGKFCHKCGEKVIFRKDFTVKKFIEQTIDVFTHFDSKIFRSTALLITKPGFLTAEYLNGRRVPYTKPVQLFFVMNLIYFLVLNYIGFDTITNPLKTHMEHFLYGKIATQMVSNKLEAQNIKLSDYENKFYDTVYVESKLLIIVMIPLFALFLKLIFIRRKKLYYEHLIFSTYFFCFILIFYTFFLNALDYILYYVTEYDVDFYNIIDINDSLAAIIVLVVTILYLFFALRTAYKISGSDLLIKTFLTELSLIGVVTIFSFFIFIVVFYIT